MSKKGKPMDSWFQIYNFLRLETLGIICIPNSFEIDFSLTFPENLRELKSFFKNFMD